VPAHQPSGRKSAAAQQPGASRDTEFRGTEVASRVADVLIAFLSTSSALGVTEVGRSVGLSKAVVYRIIQSLASRGLLEHEPDTRLYHLGPVASAFGSKALQQSRLQAAAMPSMQELWKRTGETITLSAMVGLQRTYIEQLVSPREIRITADLGRLLPLFLGGSGKAMLAFLAEELQDRVLAMTPTADSFGTVDLDLLRGELAQIHRDGFATSRNERLQGALSVAAPVFDFYGDVVASLSIAGPTSRLDDDPVVEEVFPGLVVACARRVSAVLQERASPAVRAG
jgi:IclR family transcriptional regulator, acetate operon repressor